MIRLGVNIDHVATLRNVRGEIYPNPLDAAALAQIGGADNITVHLREDRRHIKDRDVELLRESLAIPLNLEMAATEGMLALAERLKPHAVTLVPERREELTTEGGLDIISQKARLAPYIARLKNAGILCALFVEADKKVIEQAVVLGADAVEFHTGGFCHDLRKARRSEAQFSLVQALSDCALHAHKLGLQVHLGHGLNYTNAQWLQLIPHCEEANIGHAIVARALWVGLSSAVREMKELLNAPQHLPSLRGR